ncbi:MAG: helix-turn-helix domain-containing protein [Chloroflexales bacterium]|nr:helix-turn-helix domain-containing protein [Chloroflexales bacterium]
MSTNQDIKPTSSVLTIAEAAEHLKVSYRQMFRFFETGELRPIRLSDRIVRVRLEDLNDLLNRKQGAV